MNFSVLTIQIPVTCGSASAVDVHMVASQKYLIK